MSKQLFADKPYVNFENPSVQYEAEQQPDLFLKQYENGAVFDEVQQHPRMKALTLILFLALTCSVGFAQVFRIDSLPAGGVLLNKGLDIPRGR